ncbi:MAG TPA: hypothetical protein VF624_17045 [Tepidisphaeraceae bacterium]
MEDRDDLVGKRRDILCAECNRLTTHTILAAYDVNYNSEDFASSSQHLFLRCNGCGEGTYSVRYSSIEDPQPIITLHPPRGGDSRKQRNWSEVPWKGPLRNVYRQTIDTFNAGSFTLAGAGVRLLIEGIAKDQGVAEGSRLDATSGLPMNNKHGVPIRLDNLEGKITGWPRRVSSARSRRTRCTRSDSLATTRHTSWTSRPSRS